MAKIIRNSLAGAAMMALGLSLAACGGDDDAKKAEAEAAAPSRQAVTAAIATATTLPRIVTASGSVSAWEAVPVGAEAGGLVATGVFVDEGAYVRQGQPLVQLNDALLRAQLRQQQAGVAAAEANVARDEAALARARELRERGFLSQASLDTALANQRASDAGLASARASLSEIQTRVNQATIRAPVAGTVASRSVTRGQIVQPGAELFRLVRDGRLELDAQIPETELRLIRPGMTAVITSEQAGQTTGSVRIVTPEVDPRSRLGVARISLSGGTLRPGMFARAEIDVGAQPALTVPSQAIVYREGRSGVYVIDSGDRVRFQPIATGGRDGQSLAVTSGLTAGQRIVVQGAGFLGDGDLVRVVAARPEAAAAQPAQGAAR
ncbi:MAG: efflux RND transporter periplasmic adaptor subunit [Brevundimonas sp.]|uniref:efflux RND transporter periplasmic adaptor subunit n=2 Tax=Brevundimonas sp. TaxID=1871086 RepID=UPI0027333707|nr:efflux RND transporter periplasmic adaptor subunit [Brevundimonas sp.]MDP3657214.1 efflux RND transporter periplasmic adaptor subunit [Brevundimonas sp.]